jgi:hypothetical protein
MELCQARVRTDLAAAEVCEERPSATGSGGVNFERRCAPATGPAPAKDGLTFKLGD